MNVGGGAPGARAAVSAVAERLALAALAGGVLAVPLAYAGTLQSPFLAPKTAALHVVAALGFLAFGLRAAAAAGAPTLDRDARPLAGAMLLVLATTLLSWGAAALRPEGAAYAGAALARWAALGGVACGAAVVAGAAPARRTLLDAATAAAAAVSALGLLQHLDLIALPIPVISPPGATFGNRNLAAEAVALTVPLGLGALLARGEGGAPRRRAEVIGLAAALGIGVLYVAATRARGAWLGAAAGAATFALVARPRLSRRAAGLALVAVAAAGAVALLPARLDPRKATDTKRYASGLAVAEASFDPRSSAIHTRLGLWRRSLAMWREHPLLGVGPGNWPRLFPHAGRPFTDADAVLSSTLAPRQAHDDLLERASETGAVGLAALLLLGAAAVRLSRRRLRAGDEGGSGGDALAARALVAAPAGTLAALAAVGLTGFPLEMPATIFLGGLALGLLAGAPSAVRVEPRRARGSWVAVAAGVALLVAAVAGAARDLRGSYWLHRAELALFRDDEPASATAALPALARARDLAPGRFLPWFTTAQAAVRLGRWQEGEAAARRALALEPWSPNAWLVLALLELGHDPRAARDSAARALAISAHYPYALLTLARAAQAAGDPATARHAAASLRNLAGGTDGDLSPQTVEGARSLVPLLPPDV